MNEQATEAAIQAAGKTAPRVTPADVDAAIDRIYFFNGGEALKVSGGITLPIPDEHRRTVGCLTFCILVLRNGFTVTGESACASPENFDQQIGATIALQNARAKVWPLLGYALREQLASEARVPRGPEPHPSDCPHAAPFRYCRECKVSPCPIGMKG